MTPEFIRLENKVDSLLEAVTKLVIYEERQSVQALAIATLSSRTTAVEQKLDMWINRGVGVWALAASGLALYKTFGIP
jgi:hypothetical protein